MGDEYTIEELKVHNRDLLAEALAYKNNLHLQFPELGYDKMPVTPFLLYIYLPQFHAMPNEPHTVSHSTSELGDKV